MLDKKLKPFSEIRFGFASAEDEKAIAPELLEEGYYDLNKGFEEARDGSKFLILGHKGTGKSAVGAKLKLLSEKDSSLFVKDVNLGDFPYSNFAKIVSGDAEPEAKYTSAWSWILLILIIHSLKADNAAICQSKHYALVTDWLESIGMWDDGDLKKMVLASSKQSFKTQIPKLLETAYEEAYEGQDLNLVLLVEKIKEFIIDYGTPNKHLIVIDGLDEYLGDRHIQYKALASLLLEVTKLNRLFRDKNKPIKIILLCRIDLFERLPSPNKNKIRQDSSILINWCQDNRKTSNNNIFKLIRKRAQLSDPQIADPITDYFPAKIYRAKKKLPTPFFLLELTRQIPRDMIQLLSKIQEHSRGSDRPSMNSIYDGIKDYSTNYFLPEIRDELVGHFGEDVVSAGFQLLGSIRKREFHFSNLTELSTNNDRFKNINLIDFIEALFECGAIGNIRSLNRAEGALHFVTFKYRNRSATLNLNDELLILHKGLWHAMRIIEE